MALAALLSVSAHAAVHVGDSHVDGDCATCHVGSHAPAVATKAVAVAAPIPAALPVRLASVHAPQRLSAGTTRTRAPPASC